MDNELSDWRATFPNKTAQDVIVWIADLQSQLDIEKRNNPFYKELAGDFESALGKHARIDNGCWILRIEELRQRCEKLTAALKSLKPDESCPFCCDNFVCHHCMEMARLQGQFQRLLS